jgi:hypothetical protein
VIVDTFATTHREKAFFLLKLERQMTVVVVYWLNDEKSKDNTKIMKVLVRIGDEVSFST